MAAIGALILSASCAEDGLDVTGKTTAVTFTVVAPGSIRSKANNIDDNGESTIANGLNTDILFYEIYDKNDGTEKLLGEGQQKGSIEADGRMTFTFTLNLVIDQDYHILFWAHVNGADGGEKHYDVSDLRKVKIKDNYAGFKANDESRAAFYAYHSFSAKADAPTQEVALTRPFAQLNIGTSTLESSLTEDIAVQTTTVTVSNAANIFDTFAGEGKLELEGENELAVSFEAAATPHGDVDNASKLLNVNNEAYHWLGMNYILVEGLQDTADKVIMEIVTNAGTVRHTVPTVPFKKNYRTNLIGNLLTTGVEFIVVVDKLFESDRDNATDEDENVVWDNENKQWN